MESKDITGSFEVLEYNYVSFNSGAITSEIYGLSLSKSNPIHIYITVSCIGENKSVNYSIRTKSIHSFKNKPLILYSREEQIFLLKIAMTNTLGIFQDKLYEDIEWRITIPPPTDKEYEALWDSHKVNETDLN